MRRSARKMLAAAAVAALALTACGSDPREQYAVRADAICTDLSSRVGRLADAESVEDVALLTERAIPLFEDALARLRAIDPPSGHRDQIGRLLGSLEAATRALDALRVAAAGEDEDALAEAFEALQAAGDELDAGAADYGFTACGI